MLASHTASYPGALPAPGKRIVATEIRVVAIGEWVKNQDTTISVVEMGTKIVARSGNEMEAASARAQGS